MSDNRWMGEDDDDEEEDRTELCILEIRKKEHREFKDLVTLTIKYEINNKLKNYTYNCALWQYEQEPHKVIEYCIKKIEEKENIYSKESFFIFNRKSWGEQIVKLYKESGQIEELKKIVMADPAGEREYYKVILHKSMSLDDNKEET